MKQPKPRIAVLIPDIKLDTTYDGTNDRWSVHFVKVDENEKPRNFSGLSFDDSDRLFNDLYLTCTISWYGQKFETSNYHFQYRDQSVGLDNIERLAKGLKRCQRIASAFPIQTTTFGQYVALMAAGLGAQEMIRRSPQDKRRSIFYPDSNWQVLPLSHVQGIVDRTIEDAKETVLPATEVA